MVNNNKTNDWFTSILFNKDKDIPDFVAGGLNKDNTGLQSRDFYRNKSKVQKIFSDENGKFNDVAYNQFYNSTLRTYNDFISTQMEDNFIDDQIFSPRDIDVESSKKRRKPRFDVIHVKNPNSLTTGTVSMFGESEAATTAAERAQNRKIYDPGRGTFLDITPNDGGFFKRMNNVVFGSTYALAAWDEDGEHTQDDGRRVKHRKGELKYDSDGMEYYEVLGDRSPYGKQLLHATDVLTVDGSTLNKYDFFDSDSKEKSVMGQTMKVVATIAPILIKGTRSPYAYITAAQSFGSALSALFKGVTDLATGDSRENSTTWKTLNNFESFFRRFEPTVSEEAQGKMLGYENITNMLSDIVLQLYQQRAVAGLVQKTPKWLNMEKSEMDVTKRIMDKYNPEYIKKYGKQISEAIKDGTLAPEFKGIYEIGKTAERYNKIQKLGQRGSDLSKLYMAITQSGPLMETMDEAGFSTEAKVVGSLAALYGFKKIFDSELGDVALKGFGFDDVSNTTKKFFRENVSVIEKDVAEKMGQTALGTAAKLNLAKKFGNRLNKAYRWMADHPNEFVGSSVKEALEETSEELLQDGIQLSLSVLESVFRTDGSNNYNFLETNPMERYLMSALGGALGGPIFTGIDRLERGTWKTHKSIDTPTREKMMTYIREGKTDEIMESLDKIIRSNKSGVSTQLSTRIAEDVSEDGKLYFLPAESESESQAWALGENIKSWVKAVDSTINNEGFALKNDEVIFKALAQDARLHALATQSRDLNILNDFRFNLNNLIDSRLASMDLQEGQTSSNLTDKYNNAKKNLESLLNGEKAAYYTKKLAFLMSRTVNSNFIDSDIEMYAQALGLDYNSMSQESKDKLKSEYQNMLSGDPNLADGSVSSFNWSEIAFKAFENFDDVVGSAITDFTDNFAIDLQTGQMVKDDNFTNFVKDLQEVFQSDQQESLTDDEKSVVFQKYRLNKTDKEIIDIMNPNQISLSESEKKAAIENYFMSNGDAAKDIRKMEVLKWVQKNIALSEINPESIKYGIDSLTMLKTKEELKQTLFKVREIMQKYNINYIDSRTNDSLLRMEKALDSIDIKSAFDIWAKENVNGVTNIMDLLSSGEIESFTYEVEQSKEDEEFGFEIDGETLPTGPTKWTIEKVRDDKGMPIINEDSMFKSVSEYGEETSISLSEITNLIFDKYLSNVNSISDFLAVGQRSQNNITRNIEQTQDINERNDDIGDRLISSLFNKLSNDYTSRLEIIGESQQLRKQVLKNPIYAALDKISEQMLGQGEKIFTLIGREEDELGKRSTLQDYVLSDQIKRDRLLKAFKLLQAFKNVINGKVINTTDFDFNDTINHFLEKYQKLSPEQVNKENPTISPEIAAIINRDIDTIGEKLLYLINLDIINNASKFQDSARSQVRMNSLMIKVLSGTAGVKFGFIKNAKLNDEEFFNLADIDISEGDLSQVQNYIKNNSFDDEAVRHTEELLTKIKSYIYNKFNSSEIDDEIRKSLLIQMMEGLNLNIKEQRLNQNLDQQSLNGFTAFSVLLSTISSDPVKFRTLFTEELGELIPYSMQMFNSEVMCAYADNNKWFSEAINEVKANLGKYFGKSEEIAKTYESFNNLLFTWGNAGAGKTAFLARMAAKQYQRNNKDGVIWVSGPNQDRAKNLTEATGVVDNFDRIELFKRILGEKSEAFSKYEAMSTYLNENKNTTLTLLDGINQNPYKYYGSAPISIDFNGQQIKMADNIRKLSDDFISPSDIITKPDLLIIDEITKFDTFELQILDRAGIKIIGLGDRGQVSSRLFGKPHSPDGIYMNTAELSMSVRSTNIHKKDNDVILGATMNILLDQFQDDYGSSLEKTFEKEKSLMTFTYNEVEENDKYILNGEKIVNKLKVFSFDEPKGSVEGLVKSLEDNQQIVYIHNPGTSSSSYSDMQKLSSQYPGKIDFKTLDEVQGKEYKYAVIDINFTELTSPEDLYKNDELLDSLKEFKTAITRSMDGSIIVDNQTSPFHVEHSQERGYTAPTGDSRKSSESGVKTQADEYSEKIIKIIVETTPSVKVDNEKVSEGQPVDTTSELEQSNNDTELVDSKDFMKSNAQCGTFYNHLSVYNDGKKYISSGLSEDLGIFDITSQSQFKKLRKGLSFLKSYIISNKIASSGNKISDSEFLRQKNAGRYEMITEKLGFTSVNQLLNSIKNGNFAIKLTDNTTEFSQTHGSVEKVSTNEDIGVLGRIVFQIKDRDGLPYDITIGAVSTDYVKELINTGNINGKPIIKPVKNQSLYFKFNGDINWTINSMKPLTEEGGYKVKPQKFTELKENHPEIIISKPILSKTGANKGKSFAIYSYNLFESSETEQLGKLRNYELKNNQSEPKTTSVIYLDRVGYTVEQWMDKFRAWMQNPDKRKDLEMFTGYMTPARFVISMIEYYNQMEEGPKKEKLRSFLNGRVETKLATSRVLELSKTKENMELITEWINDVDNKTQLQDWVTKTETSLFKEENFMKSSKKISEILRGSTAKDVFVKLEDIKQQIIKDPEKFGDKITPEIIDDFTREIRNLINTFKTLSEMPVGDNDEGTVAVNIVSQWLNDGILIKSSKMQSILFDIYNLWFKGETGSEALGNKISYGSEDFREMFSNVIEDSKFFQKQEIELNGATETRSMIFIEGKAYLPNAPDKGAINGSYYYDSNPESNFTVSSNIQLPSVYFKNTPGSVDLNATSSQVEIQEQVKVEETKPVIVYNNKIKQDLLNLQPNNESLKETINRLIPDDNSLTVNQLKNKIESMFNSRSTIWEDKFETINGVNYFIDKPKVAVKDEEIILLPVKTKLSQIYSAVTNDKSHDIDTVEITEYKSLYSFKFKDQGIEYEFKGSSDGTFTLETLSTIITPQMINDVLQEFKEDGELYGAEEDFDLVYDNLTQRYQNNVALFNEDTSRSDFDQFYKGLIISFNPNIDSGNLDLIMSSIYEKNFNKLKCE